MEALEEVKGNPPSSSRMARYPEPSAPSVDSLPQLSASAEAKHLPFMAQLPLPNPSAASLPSALSLLDVREDSKEYQAIARLLAPVVISMKFPAGLADNYFNYKLFAEPVLISESGETYEKEVILQWLTDHDTDPIQIHTKVAKKPNLVIIQNAKRAVDEFLNQNDEVRDSAHVYLPQSWVRELELACAQGDVNQIKFLCGRDRRLVSWKIDDFDIKNSQWQGKRALHIACAQGTLSAVEELLRLAEIRAEGLGLLLLLQPDGQGKLPIHYAVLNRQSPQLAPHLAAHMGKALLEIKPLAVSSTSEDQASDTPREITALHFAAMHGDSELLTTLLKSHPTNLNSRDHLGNTALHIVIEHGAEAVMILLMRTGAAYDIENDQGQTAQMLATAGRPGIATKFAELIKELEESLGRQGPLGLRLLQQQSNNARLQVEAVKQRQQIRDLQELSQAQAAELVVLKQAFNRSLTQSEELEHKEKYVHQHHPELTVFSAAKPITSAGELRQLIEQRAKNPFLTTARFLYRQPSDSKTKFSLKRTLGEANQIGVAALLPDGSIVTADMGDGQHWVWNVKEGTRVKKHASASASPISVLAIAPSNNYVVSASSPVKTVQYCKCDVCKSYSYDADGLAAGHAAKEASYQTTHQIAENQRNRHLPRFYSKASAVGNYIEVWDIKESKQMAKYALGNKWIAAVLALPEGGIVASAETYGELTAYGSVGWMARYDKPIRALAWLSTERIVGGADDCTLQVWDTRNGTRISTLLGHKSPVTALAVLADGAQVISGSHDGELRLWDIAKGSCEAVCGGHSAWLKNVAVNAIALLGSCLVASASNDGTVKVWQIGKGKWDCIETLQHKVPVKKILALKEDGFISHTEDGNLHVWQGGLPLELNLQFCSALVGAAVEQQADGQILMNLAEPSKQALDDCAQALRALCPDSKLVITIPNAQKLVIGGLKDDSQRHELVELIEAFGAKKQLRQGPVSFGMAYSQSVLPPPVSFIAPAKGNEKLGATPVARLTESEEAATGLVTKKSLK